MPVMQKPDYELGRTNKRGVRYSYLTFNRKPLGLWILGRWVINPWKRTA